MSLSFMVVAKRNNEKIILIDYPTSIAREILDISDLETTFNFETGKPITSNEIRYIANSFKEDVETINEDIESSKKRIEYLKESLPKAVSLEIYKEIGSELSSEETNHSWLLEEKTRLQNIENELNYVVRLIEDMNNFDSLVYYLD